MNKDRYRYKDELNANPIVYDEDEDIDSQSQTNTQPQINMPTAQSVTNAVSKLGGNKKDGQAETQKMKNNPINSNSNKVGKGTGSSNAQGKSNAVSKGVNAVKGKLGGKSASKSSGASSKGAKGSSGASSNSTSSSSTSQGEVDKGGKYDLKKSLLNKFKFKLQKNTKEEEKAEAEANRCDPCNEFKAGNGLDLGCVDWGKCAFAKPCCKKFPYPCSCMAYMCFGVTFIGGLLGSIILF